MDEAQEPTIPLDLHGLLEASILLHAVLARVEDLQEHNDTWSISEAHTLHDIAKRIQEKSKQLTVVASKDAS
jgi:hypothetical protein